MTRRLLTPLTALLAVLIGVVAAIAGVRSTGDRAGSSIPVGTGLSGPIIGLELNLPSAQVQIMATPGHASVQQVPAHAVSVAAADGRVWISCRSQSGCGNPRLVIRLPERSALTGRIGRGRLEVTGMSGPVHLTSDAAEVNVISDSAPIVKVVTVSATVHVSLLKVPRMVGVRTVSGPIYITVPYDYPDKGYSFAARSGGYLSVDMTRSKSPRAARVVAGSRSGQIAIEQRYPNMS